MRTHSAARLTKQAIELDDRRYHVQVMRNIQLPPEAPRLLIVAFQPNQTAQHILRVCIQAIKCFTPEPHELWIIDNNSPLELASWLLNLPDVNVVLNRTEPLPLEARPKGWRQNKRVIWQPTWGSYANAVGLELGIRLIDSDTHYVMTLHMDTMPSRIGWLSFLRSKLNDSTKAVGVRMDRVRIPEGILHVLGYMVDFQCFQNMNLNFFPQLPDYDVGDYAIVTMRDAGYELFACRNTLWQPELVDLIQPQSPLYDFKVDRSFDDVGHVIFLHLGRGINKSANQTSSGVSPEEWVSFGLHWIDNVS
jgi:hypothetical protein